jgi:F-type H+-transporting ATPase subunit b
VFFDKFSQVKKTKPGKGYFTPDFRLSSTCLSLFSFLGIFSWWSFSPNLEGILAEGFGLNFDIIETNILNLGVVIAVVVYLGSDVLTSLLNERKEKILSTLKNANERFVEAEQKLAEAKQKVQIAQGKAVEIREQGNLTAAQTTKNLAERTEEEMKRLEESKQATLRFEEEKALGQVRQQVVSLSIERAFNLLRTKIDASVQRRLIDANINLLGKL